MGCGMNCSGEVGGKGEGERGVEGRCEGFFFTKRKLERAGFANGEFTTMGLSQSDGEMMGYDGCQYLRCLLCAVYTKRSYQAGCKLVNAFSIRNSSSATGNTKMSDAVSILLPRRAKNIV